MKAADAKILGLTENQLRLLRALKGGPHSIGMLVGRSGLARMTVYSVLASLSRRGLVQKITYGKRYRYTANEIVAPQGTGSLGLRTISGRAAIFETYRQLLSEHGNRRVYAIQPSRSAEFLLKKVPARHVEEINDAIKKYRIIVDVITSPSILDLSRRQTTRWKHSMLGRTTSVTLIPDNLLKLPGELWIFKEAVLMTNWEKEICILQTDAAVVEMYRALYAILKETGRVFDSNEFLRTSL